jgi:hypothetical protein
MEGGMEGGMELGNQWIRWRQMMLINPLEEWREFDAPNRPYVSFSVELFQNGFFTERNAGKPLVE